jgi:hypothetical protein
VRSASRLDVVVSFFRRVVAAVRALPCEARVRKTRAKLDHLTRLRREDVEAEVELLEMSEA